LINNKTTETGRSINGLTFTTNKMAEENTQAAGTSTAANEEETKKAETKTYTAQELQEERDRIASKVRAEEKKKLEKREEEIRQEEKELAKLSDKEKEEKTRADERNKFEQEKKGLALDRNKYNFGIKAANDKLPVDAVDLILSPDEEVMAKNYDRMKTIMDNFAKTIKEDALKGTSNTDITKKTTITENGQAGTIL
jgi:uncharacterized protein DUF4355